MLISSIFAPKYVTAADLQGRHMTLEIQRVTLETMRSHSGEDVKKPVIWFLNARKGFVLNATNARAIAEWYGDDTDHWPGRHVTIYPARVRAFGEMMDAIRVRRPTPDSTQTVSAPNGELPDEEFESFEDIEDHLDHDQL